MCGASTRWCGSPTRRSTMPIPPSRPRSGTVCAHDPVRLAQYVHGSAEVVGLMCLRVFVDGSDAEHDRLAPAARALGAAFQKVNFLRDLAEDHDELGRTYFPGLDPDAFDDA